MSELLSIAVANKIKGIEPGTIREIMAIERRILELSPVAFHAYEKWCSRRINMTPFIRSEVLHNVVLVANVRYSILVKVIQQHRL
jgi:hypothetical protein